MKEPGRRPIPPNVQQALRNREVVIAFSGHRSDRLLRVASEREICEQLRATIEQAYLSGKRVFLNGAMHGFDIMAAEQVLVLKRQYLDILCGSIGPFQIDFFARNGWSADWKDRALDVFHRSDFRYSLYARYFPGVYYRRNEFLVDHSSALICFWDRGTGGTAQTVQYAQNKIPIQNIYQAT